MELSDFLKQVRSDVATESAERLTSSGVAYPFPELIFTEIVMHHLEDVGMTYDPQVCHVDKKISNATVRLSGYAVAEDGDRIDLFVALYRDSEDLQSVGDAETKQAAEHCFRFLRLAAEGKMLKALDPADEARDLAQHIEFSYAKLEEVRIYVLTDGIVKSKNFKSQEVSGKTVRLEVMDIERLNRHLSEGRPRDELVVNFADVAGGPLPCVYIESSDQSYDYAMAVMPGDVLRFLYDKYGDRLLEANVRSFLSATGKVNKGIQNTLRTSPEKFVAFNNGIVIVADEASLGTTSEGGPGIAWLKGMQIVNGGQTTASIYFTKKKYPDTDLRHVRVPAKIVVLKTNDSAAEEALISDVSRYANSQNTVKQSDLSANAPFHVELEKLSNSVYLPNGVGRWFYERAAGSYATLLAREGNTPAKYRKLKTDVVPPSRRLTKTDLAKALNCWEGRPQWASLGGQKNFAKFMDSVREREERGEFLVSDAQGFKQTIARVIVFRHVQSLMRPLFPAFQGNVGVYLVALMAHCFGDRFDLQRVWESQGLSDAFKQQLRIWAMQVNEVLHSSANGKMISEWAKRDDCWVAVQRISLDRSVVGISELR